MCVYVYVRTRMYAMCKYVYIYKERECISK